MLQKYNFEVEFCKLIIIIKNNIVFIFQNPEKKPLNELIFLVKENGVQLKIPALVSILNLLCIHISQLK